MRKHARIAHLPGYWGVAAELAFYLAPSYKCTDSTAKGSSFSQHIWSPLSFSEDLQLCNRSFNLPSYAVFMYNNTLAAFGRAFLSFLVRLPSKT
eukprot:s439_g12.t1